MMKRRGVHEFATIRSLISLVRSHVYLHPASLRTLTAYQLVTVASLKVRDRL